MSRSQLRKDLHNRIDENLFRWCKDSIDLYDMADLSERMAVADAIFSMMTGIGALAAAFNVNPEALERFFANSLEVTGRKFAEKAQEDLQ